MSIAEGYGSPAELQEQVRSLRAQLADALKENEEQARLLGMGSEREARLMAQLAEAQRGRDETNKGWQRTYDHDVRLLKERADKAGAELAAEKARAGRLEGAIRNAPHWGDCAMFNAPYGPCNCWKREALEGKACS